MSKYTEIMEHVQVTVEMRERVLNNIEQRAHKNSFVVYLKRYGAIAACFILVLVGSVIIAQGGIRRSDVPANGGEQSIIGNLPSPDQIGKEADRIDTLKQPSRKDLDSINTSIEYPKKEDYLNKYTYARLQSQEREEIPGFETIRQDGMPYLLPEGEKVVVLAEHGDYSCVLVPSQNRAFWIRNEFLFSEVDETNNDNNIGEADNSEMSE